MKKKTKIVCTLGPATSTKEIQVAMIEAGMNVARFNFSHGDHESHKTMMDSLKAAREESGQSVAILLDTKGPEIRTHLMENDGFDLVEGQVIRVSMREVLGTPDKFSVTYPNLIEDVHVNSHILIDDGLIDLLVTELDHSAGEIVCKVLNPGRIKSRKGVNVPHVSLQIPGITERDEEDIRFGCQQEIDYIAASFIRRASDVLEIRRVLEEENHLNIQIVAKIENHEGVKNIDEIIKVADGIMVARGDLGVEVPTEDVPIIQKEIIKKCNLAGKPVVTATQMLDSMQRNPRPTRAEAGDVANAIFDGTDAVMLSGETASGEYPVEAVKTMATICVRTEENLDQQDAFTLKALDKSDLTEAIGQAVGHTAKNLGIKTIVAATSSGHTARMIAKYRPAASILAATFDEKTQRALSLVWGVQAYVIDKPSSTDHMLDSATDLALNESYAQEGDLILITAGVPVGEEGTTNLMKIQLIGTKLTEGQGVGQHDYIGKAVIARDSQEAIEKMFPGAILVTYQTDRDYGPVIAQAGAIICQEGGITSHAAIVGLELNIPVIVSCSEAMSMIQEGELITVDARRGIVYRGATVSI